MFHCLYLFQIHIFENGFICRKCYFIKRKLNFSHMIPNIYIVYKYISLIWDKHCVPDTIFRKTFINKWLKDFFLDLFEEFLITAAWSSCEEKLGFPSLLINNAGICNEVDWRKTFDVNMVSKRRKKTCTWLILLFMMRVLSSFIAFNISPLKKLGYTRLEHLHVSVLTMDCCIAMSIHNNCFSEGEICFEIHST